MDTKKRRQKSIVILAAGKGSRLGERSRPKPLTRFLGMPLLERTIRAFRACGAREFLVVTGFRHREIEAFLEKLSKRLNNVTIRPIYNQRWEMGNGTSFLAAAPHVKGDFVLTMCDHVFSKDLMVQAMTKTPPPGGMGLFVDTRIDNPVIDKDDATKVFIDEERITAIGKGLERYSGFDTGLFVCSRQVFHHLDALSLDGKTLGLSTIFQYLSDMGHTCAYEIRNGFWADLDDLNAFKRAEKALFMLLRGKAHDGPVSRLLNRPLSIRLTSLLVNTPITPNQVTLVSFFLATLASLFLTKDSYLWFAMGGIMAQLASIIDGCDGEIARLKWQQSEYGAWLDAVLDRYADAFLICGITWHVANYHSMGNAGWLLGTIALVGSLINSYTADKYDGWMKSRKKVQRFRLGRDVRIFLVFLSTIFYRPVELLVMLAGIMHTENIRRMWQLRTA